MQKTAYELRISDWSSDVCSSDLSLGSDAGHRERSLEAPHLQPQPVVRRLVAEVGLVERDVAERGPGAGGRVGAQVGVGAVLFAAEAACHPGAHGPALAEDRKSTRLNSSH